MFESLDACGDDSGLQSRDDQAVKACGIGEKTDHASGSGRQAHVGIQVQVEDLGLSCHGW
jgi:hypothetical protein